ncbi:MAG: protein kinase [Acutalibacter sp.]|nr:protein kinase [Acutalibacter sp.]
MGMETVKQTWPWPEWEADEKPLGTGSFGAVYKAVRRDNNVESYAAIKVISIPQNESEVDSLRSEGMSEGDTREYFQGVVNEFVGEIQLMDSFKGVPNIVSIEDYKVVEKADGIGWDIYIRMELLTPFNTYIRDKALSEQEVIKLGCDICTALELCAQRNVIHRDIKPENIFVNQFGYYKLGDFGIARKLENVTGGLSQKGTYNYMAPEVERGPHYGATVDLYSLGLVLYRLLNKNRLPFLDTEQQQKNPNERTAALRRRMNGEPLPAPCDASPAMASVILCACAYDPNMRFASATAMKNALMSVGSSPQAVREDPLNKTVPICRPAETQDPNRTVSVRKAPEAQREVNTFGKKKSKLPVIIAAVLVVALLVGGGVFGISKLLGGTSPSFEIEQEEDGSWKKIEYLGKIAVSEQRYTADDQLYYSWKREFDNSENRVTDFWYDTDGNVGLYAENEYDSAGNAVKTTFYLADDTLDCWCEREYDRAGNETRTWYRSDGTKYRQYGYDSVGNEIKEIYYSEGGISDWDEYEYDAVGNEIKWTSYNLDGSINFWDESQYDAAGNEKRTIRYNSDGSIDYGTEYEYDEAGNQVKLTTYNSDGSISQCHEYEYDAAGNEIKWTRYNSDGSIDDWDKYEYDAAGNKIKWTRYNSDGSIDYGMEYEYDEAGNQVKLTIYNSDGSINSWYEYEYDAAENQTKEIGYHSDGSISFWYEYVYDVAGNEIRFNVYNSDGSIAHCSEYAERILID